MIALYNGRLYTQDYRSPLAEALLIDGQRIVRVGSNEEALDACGSGDERIDLQGRAVLPGFIDSHFHLFDWALDYDDLELGSCRSLADLQRLVVDQVARGGESDWLLGHGFDHTEWPEGRLPDRHDLDQVSTVRPICLWRCDLHTAVANSRALQLAGIDRQTVSPADGLIEREENNEPNGILRESAPNLIRAVLPELSAAQIQNNLDACIAELHGLGITSVHDARLMSAVNGRAALSHFQQLHNQGRLRMRIQVGIPGEFTEQAMQLGLRTGLGDDLLSLGGLKFFADGGMGSRTAWLVDPYLDGGCGTPLTPVVEIGKAVAQADAAGLSVMVHAIGDRANREVIAMFESLAPFQAPLGHRIEHAQLVQPEDVAKLGAIDRLTVSCQPNNLSLDVTMIDGCVADRGRFAYPFRDMLRSGVPLMFSSDAPVCDPAPLAGIASAVTRQRLDGTPPQGWYPDQRLTVTEAVQAYTLTPAMVSGMGAKLGSLTAGKYADLVVLDQDIHDVEAPGIAATRVLLTICNGEAVYQRGSL